MHYKTFSPADQLLFARLSGDFNPIHVDPVAARRLTFGKPVVHGIQVLLWSIDEWLKEQEMADGFSPASAFKLTQVKAKFRRPIIVDQSVELLIHAIGATQARLKVSAEGAQVMTFDCEFVISDKAQESKSAKEEQSHIEPTTPPQLACLELSAPELLQVKGSLPLFLDPQLAAKLFPTASRLLNREQISALLAATRLVGMTAPGLHSIFSDLELKASDNVFDHCDVGNLADLKSHLAYQSESFDHPFSLLKLSVRCASLSGHLKAILRPKPVQQASLSEIQEIVKSDEFIGQRALVIGGSRGLGELAVKALIAGGAQVRFTYHRGSADAARLVAEIAAHKNHQVSCYQYDATDPKANLTEHLAGWNPTVLCYFATPHIATSTAGDFSLRLFYSFCQCYVDGFMKAFRTILQEAPDLQFILYPSTVYVDELPPKLAEYISAKSAAE